MNKKVDLMETIKKTIGQNLKVIRNEKKQTLDEYSSHFDKERGTWAPYEYGDRALPLDIIYRLHTEHGIDLNWLFSGKGSKYVAQSKNGSQTFLQAAEEAENLQIDLVYSNETKPDKKALKEAFSACLRNLMEFYLNPTELDRVQIIENHKKALEPLQNLF